MTPTRPRSRRLAQQLLDAQVAHHLDRWSEDRCEATVTALARDLLALGERHELEDLVDRETVTAVVVRGLATIPPSAAASGLVELLTEVAYDGPAEPFALDEVTERAQMARLAEAVLALNPLLGRLLDGLADVPLVGTVASRFMGRVVGEVLATNKAVADKVPGLGSLMSLGSSAASRMMGAADKQLEGLVGDTLGKGGSFAVRRLTRVVMDTLRDPTTREAVLQAWDVIAREEVTGLREHVSREELVELADALHDVAITALTSEQAAVLVEVLVDAFFDRFGGYSPAELLDQLDLTADDVVADAARLAGPVVGALRESGDLEHLLRRELEPFYASAEVADLLS